MLSRPKASTVSATDPNQQAARHLADCLLLLSSPDSNNWGGVAVQQGQGQGQVGAAPVPAQSVSRAVLLHLLQQGSVYQLLLRLLLQHTPTPQGVGSSAAAAAAVAGAAAGGVSYAETICTFLMVQLLKIAGAASAPATTTTATTAPATACAGPAAGLHLLLCLPGLWTRASSLKPVAGRIVRQAVLDLAADSASTSTAGAAAVRALGPATGAGAWTGAGPGPGAGGAGIQAAPGSSWSPQAASCLTPGALAAALPGDIPGGRVAAAAALVGNILAVGTVVLPAASAQGQVQGQVQGQGQGQQQVALALVQVLHAALAVLPRAPFLDAGGGVGGVGGAAGVDRAGPKQAGEGRVAVDAEGDVLMQDTGAAQAATSISVGELPAGAVNNPSTSAAKPPQHHQHDRHHQHHNSSAGERLVQAHNMSSNLHHRDGRDGQVTAVWGADGRLRWDGSVGAVPPALVAGVQQLWHQGGGVALMRRLVSALLPAACEADRERDAATTAAESGVGGVGAKGPTGHLGHAAGGYALCQLLQQVGVHMYAHIGGAAVTGPTMVVTGQAKENKAGIMT